VDCGFFLKRKETLMMKNSIHLFVAGALLAGCTPQVAKLEVTPANVTLHKVDQIANLKLMATDESGKVVENPQVTWTSADPTIATVDATSTVTAKKSGTTKITVQAGQVVAEVPVTVAIYSALKVNPDKLNLEVGGKGALKAQILDEKGAPLAGTVTWTSQDEKLAKVDAQGNVEAVAPGTAKLMARAQDLSATVDVTIAAAAPVKGGKKGKK
jgi:uncharacterized protein YjdB